MPDDQVRELIEREKDIAALVVEKESTGAKFNPYKELFLTAVASKNDSKASLYVQCLLSRYDEVLRFPATVRLRDLEINPTLIEVPARGWAENRTEKMDKWVALLQDLNSYIGFEFPITKEILFTTLAKLWWISEPEETWFDLILRIFIDEIKKGDSLVNKKILNVLRMQLNMPISSGKLVSAYLYVMDHGGQFTELSHLFGIAWARVMLNLAQNGSRNTLYDLFKVLKPLSDEYPHRVFDYLEEVVQYAVKIDPFIAKIEERLHHIFCPHPFSRGPAVSIGGPECIEVKFRLQKDELPLFEKDDIKQVINTVRAILKSSDAVRKIRIEVFHVNKHQYVISRISSKEYPLRPNN